VKAHMTAILKKLDVQNRTQAVLAAKALGVTLAHD
jgi:DNA-binding NarL/FixJ family response regulator